MGGGIHGMAGRRKCEIKPLKNSFTYREVEQRGNVCALQGTAEWKGAILPPKYTHTPTHPYPSFVVSLCKSEAGWGPGQESKMWGAYQGGTCFQQAERNLVKD